MKYLSGIHALNITCSLDTSGDWHQPGLHWSTDKLFMLESDHSVFGDYGIEKNVQIPEHEELFNVANHIRALLDLLDVGYFSIAGGMKNDFIDNDQYTDEIFAKVSMLHGDYFWQSIDTFMEKEYKDEWLDYKRRTV